MFPLEHSVRRIPAVSKSVPPPIPTINDQVFQPKHFQGEEGEELKLRPMIFQVALFQPEH
jgi:hypothetical protein